MRILFRPPEEETMVQTQKLAGAVSLALLLSALGPAAAAAEPMPLKVDPSHSSVSFTIRHFVSNVPGRFKDFEGVIQHDRQKPEASSVSFTVQAGSIETDNDERDEHLRSADFFDVQKFPTLTFTSTSVKAKDADELDVTGDFTLHGVTRRITIPVQVLGTVKGPHGEKAGFETSFTINRKDYGIVWNRVLDAGPMLGDDVRITVSVEANRQDVQPAK
jgi:polyisoprenoid-binding protein YceI